MIHDPEYLDRLQSLESTAWSGTVFRHMFGDYDPLSENSLGARWNPPGVPALYASPDISWTGLKAFVGQSGAV